ncbi:MAG: hypothetical protein LQ346_003078 [Caloplaca aetnensis]|nr:MAG: hypothetical protein LQ346_003078 [Caloplaca aetnensis]
MSLPKAINRAAYLFAPETKQLKKLVRDIVDPSRDLGHVDRQHASQAAPPTSSNNSPRQLTNGDDIRSASLSTTQQAENMVADILSALPPSLTKQGGKDNRKEENSPAKVSASETAEKMVADIRSAFSEEEVDTHEAAKVGGGSGGVGTDDRIEKVGTAGVEDRGEEEGEAGEYRQGCEDCG